MKIVLVSTNSTEHTTPKLSPSAFQTMVSRLSNRQQKTYKKLYGETCFVHAEVQLLLHVRGLPPNTLAKSRVFNYMGCSKKTCYLCCQLLDRDKHFRTRGSHDKVYHRWTVPNDNRLQLESMFHFKVALRDIERDMISRFERFPKGCKMAEKPESSVGLSEHSTRSLGRHRLRRSGLHDGALSHPPLKIPTEDAPMVRLGKKTGSFRAARIPAEKGCPPDMVQLDTFETKNDYKGDDSDLQHVPDFSAYWGNAYNFDRAIQRISVTNQNLPSLDGEYAMWWNTNDALPPNASLMKILGLENVPFYRRLWYGDVFIERMGLRDGKEYDDDAYHLYDDISLEVFGSAWLEKVITGFWGQETLEEHLKGQATAQDFYESYARDKDLVLQRM